MPYLGLTNKCRIGSLSSTGESLNLNEHYIKLNQDEVGSGVDENVSGLIVERGSLPDAYLQFNETIKDWEYGVAGNMQLIGTKLVSINTSSILLRSHTYFVDSTERPLTLLLPQFPRPGDTVTIIDSKGMFDINMVTIGANSNRMMGSTENFFLDLKYANVKFTYLDIENGWIVSPSNPITLSNIDIENPSGGVNLTPTGVIAGGPYNRFTVDTYGRILTASLVNTPPSTGGDLGLTIETRNSNFTAEKFKYYAINTSFGIINVTPPSNPVNGDWFGIIDDIDNFGINKVTILNFNTGTLNLDVSSINIRCIYVNNKWTVLDDTIGSFNLESAIVTRSSNFTIESNVIYEVDTSSAPLSITLPTNVRNGNWFNIIDVRGTFAINNCTILFNGTHTILKNSGNLILDSNYTSLKLIFNNGNWSMCAN